MCGKPVVRLCGYEGFWCPELEISFTDCLDLSEDQIWHLRATGSDMSPFSHPALARVSQRARGYDCALAQRSGRGEVTNDIVLCGSLKQ